MDPYERRFAALLGDRFSAFAFWKGRVGLYALLRALELEEGAEVIVPAYTCIVVPNAIRQAGAVPVYADIAPRHYNIDPASVEALITPRTRALIVQHTYGLPAPIDALQALAERHRLRVIEDCAHVLVGSTVGGRRLGTASDAAFFSFQWSKPYTTGLGGMVVTQDDDLAKRLGAIQETFRKPPLRRTLQLRLQYQIHRRLFRPRRYWFAERVLHRLGRFGLFVASSSPDELTGTAPGDLQWRMSAFQKRAGGPQLESLTENATHRHRLSAFYSATLDRHAWPVPDTRDAGDPPLVRYPLRVANKAALLAAASQARVELGSWFETPLHPLPLRDHYLAGYRPGQCPVAEATAAQVVNLPLHSRVTLDEAERTLRLVLSRATRPASLVEAHC